MRAGVPPSRGSDEANVSAQQQASEENARISRAHGDAGRSGDPEAPAREGTKEAHRVHSAEAAALSGSRRFPARARLKERREFLRVERLGRRVASAHFVLLAERRDDGWRRLGVTVSRRVGGAVTRNRVKRFVREFFRSHRETLPAADAVVIARSGAANLEHGAVADELGRLWARLAG